MMTTTRLLNTSIMSCVCVCVVKTFKTYCHQLSCTEYSTVNCIFLCIRSPELTYLINWKFAPFHHLHLFLPPHTSFCPWQPQSTLSLICFLDSM